MNTEQLSKTTNETDPLVVRDPSFPKTEIIKFWQPQNKGEETTKDTGKNTSNEDQTRVDGIKYPILLVNKTIIDRQHIRRLKLRTISGVPSLGFSIVKSSDITFIKTIGLVNKVTVVFLPPVDGTYRKISLDFYIEKTIDSSDTITYICSLLYPKLRKKYTKSISNGSTNLLTTYELFEQIAKETELGFAATPQCKEIADKRLRISTDQTFKEVLDMHIKFAGVDKNSLFTYWIDFYGNIVLCNLAWVLSKAVNYNELSIKQLQGENITDSIAFNDKTIEFTDDTFRTITNVKVKDSVQANIIRTYSVESNTLNSIEHGTNNTYYIINHITNGGNNFIESEKTTISEKTADGEEFKDLYNFEINEYRGVELGLTADGNSPVLRQEIYRDAFLLNTNIKTLKVELKTPHLGLQRGTLINVVIYEYDSVRKMQLLANMNNINSKKGEQDTEIETTDYDAETLEGIKQNPDIGVPDLSVSGMYYINGIDLDYTQGIGITQTLYLIRKSPEATYQSFLSAQKIIK